MNRELELSKMAWRDCLTAHPDGDMEGVVEIIVKDTQEITLKAVGEWLEGQCYDKGDNVWLADIDRTNIEALKRGEFPNGCLYKDFKG